MADPIVLEWQEQGLSALLRSLARLDESLEGIQEETRKTSREQTRQARSQSDLSRQTRTTGRALRAYGDSLSGMNSRVGRSTRQLGRLVQVFGTAGAAGGPAGLALAGVATALVAVATGAGVAVKGLIETAKNGRALIEELEPLKDTGLLDGLGDDALERFDRVSASFDAIGASTKAAALLLAEQFLPIMENVALMGVAVALAIKDNASAIGEFTNDLFSYAKQAAEFVEGLDTFARGALGLVTLGFSEHVATVGAVADSFQSATTSSTGYIAQARELIDTQEQVNATMRQGAAEVVDYFASWDALSELSMIAFEASADQLDAVTLATIRATQAADEQIAKIDELAIAYADVATVQSAAADARREVEAKLNRDLVEINRDATQAIFDELDLRLQESISALEQYQEQVKSGMITALVNFGEITQGLSDLLVESGGRGAVALFRINQAAGIANSTVATAQGVATALGAAPPPLNFVNAGIVGALGAVQIAKIAAQQPPQVQAHSGMSAGGGLRVSGRTTAPDEQDLRVLAGEATVFSTQGTQAIVNAINRSQMPGAGSIATVRATIGRDHEDRFLDRSSRGGTSRYAKNLKRVSRASARGQKEW